MLVTLAAILGGNVGKNKQKSQMRIHRCLFFSEQFFYAFEDIFRQAGQVHELFDHELAFLHFEPEFLAFFEMAFLKLGCPDVF